MATNDSHIEKSLFFAYARRTDHNTFSRYMLTFADRDTAEDWWKLVQTEYPDSVRSNPQLFSFTGDGRPSQIWENKKFDHLKTKWLYTQFGDAKDTRGSAQATIPVQAGSYTGTGGSSAAAGGSLDLSELSAVLQKSNQDNSDKVQAAFKRIPEQIQELIAAQSSSAGNLDRLQKIVEQQIAQLAEAPKDQSGQKTSSSEDTQQLHTIIQEQNKQMEEARKSSSAETDRLQKIIEQQSKQNEALTSKMGDVATLLQKSSQPQPGTQSSASPDLERLSKIVGQQNKQIDALTSKLADVANILEKSGHACRCSDSVSAPAQSQSAEHDVKPPPRKLNRKVLGYTYT
ncbi:hypothetical protein K431DRAFT_305129 [Polychaeton citri CBS 116435]|uniref:Uncharacterized protein n=1 Tax=Polychaeton citri CBS 116435 TaxID=1314669 RepID=A0A9P4UKX5_9PEZI|nr:hypothetical protein K431DRAFT_305129 [Polychaeton citri CBS 116435]